MKRKIKKMIKKIIMIIKLPFIKVSYINNYIYKDELLIGRTALITGGTTGIGYSIAKLFLINGANVIITGRDQKKIDRSIKELKKYLNKQHHNDIFGFEMDISDTKNINSHFEKIVDYLENIQIDILVNNAGVILGANIGETKIEDYEKCMQTNLEGMYFLSQSFFEYMKKNKLKGNILNVLSSSSMRPAVKPYTLSKWGAKGLTIGMAKKFIEYGIVVNGIAPGPTATPMLIDELDGDNLFLNSSPSKRYVTSEEIANGALFLVSDLGKMVVGDILYMTGGAGIVTVDDINY